MIRNLDLRDRRRAMRVAWCSLAAAAAIGFVSAANAAGPSAFCHTVDGTFTDCTLGLPVEEWSDIPGSSFLNNQSHVYGDQDIAGTTLYLMYDYPVMTAPLGVGECSSVDFDVAQLNQIFHYTIRIGNCSTGGFDVLVNSVKLPERLEEGILGVAGFGLSPNEPLTPHQMFEVSVPLGLVYSPDDPRFWSSAVSNPPFPPGDDFDGDNVLNDIDNCVTVSNPLQEDFDATPPGDACTPCPGEDSDGDGVPDGSDNCPSAANVTQRDKDGDGLGRPCDSCPVGPDVMVDCGGKAQDSDHDGVANEEDKCPLIFNSAQDDIDADGFGDDCDPCVNDPTNSCSGPPQCKSCFADSDGDGDADNEDNCRNIANGAQTDGDGDEVGDACDNCPASALDDCPVKDDGDADTVINENDNCVGTANLDQADADFDGFGDLCDACADDDTNSCVACVEVGPSHRGVGNDSVPAHGAIVNAKSDGTTDSTPLAECPNPELCGDDIPKDVAQYVKKRLGAIVKCAKLGDDPCDLSKSNEIAISAACRGAATCMVDSAAEVLLGGNNPNPVEMTDVCAKALAKEGSKFVAKQVQNRSKNRDDLTPAQEVARKAALDSKCASIAGVSVGPACVDDDDTLEEIKTCVFDQLKRAQPLPPPDPIP